MEVASMMRNKRMAEADFVGDVFARGLHGSRDLGRNGVKLEDVEAA